MRAHLFDSTREAYDACQTDDDVKAGDVLIIASEKVIGVAYTWPFAVTLAHGKLHSVATSLEDFKANLEKDPRREAITAGIEEAVKLAMYVRF